ncbi:MAG: cytochrome c3 family protein [Coriobacteriia bacterium]|nr:cytochrome c3 family protein [Coriobacteriia bacterium]
MTEQDLDTPVRSAGETTGETSSRRGRGVFAAVVLLLLLLCSVTTIMQTFSMSGDDEVVRGVIENLECLQCHTELIPEFELEVVHNPFMAEQCTTCHTPHGRIETETVFEGAVQEWNRMRTLVEWIPVKLVLELFDTGDGTSTAGGDVKSVTETQVKGETSELVLPGNELCMMCHGDMGPMINAAYPHAPFANGNCVDCHDPHASDMSSMLTMTVEDLCITCHRLGPQLARMQLHAPVEGFHCTNCHNPHGSAYRGILVDAQRDLCFTCHPSVARLSGMAVQHGPYANDACTDCHEPHGSDFAPLLRAAQPDLCYGCHPAVETDFLRASHHPVGTISLDCTGCHDAHATNYQGLLYDEDNGICYDCHARPIQATYDTSAHSATPCWGCHTPHGSDYGPLLKAAQPTVCFSCHARGSYDDAAGGYQNHPVRPAYYDVNAKKALTCTTTCHAPHGTVQGFQHLLRNYEAGLDGNCLICHAVVPGQVVGVDF